MSMWQQVRTRGVRSDNHTDRGVDEEKRLENIKETERKKDREKSWR